MRPRMATAILATAAAALTAAGAASAATSRYSDGPLTATFSYGTTHPNCKQKWPVTVAATYHGKAVHATAKYQFLDGGQLVSTQYPFSGTSLNRGNRLWHFYGSFYDYTFGPFGALSVGYTLNVRAVVSANGHTAYPGTYVRVVKVRGCPAVH